MITAFDTVGKGTVPGAPPKQNSPTLVRASLSDGISPENLKLVCTFPVHSDPAFKQCLSFRPIGNRDAMDGPQDPEMPIRVCRVMKYLLEDHAINVKMPVVTVVRGAEVGIREIQRVARGEVSKEKVFIEPPL